MKITKIEKLKNNRYKIIIDDEKIITYDNVILSNNLLYKKVIDNNIYKKILDDTVYYDMYNKTINYVLKRRRSENNIRCYLEKSDLKLESKEKIISKLKEINLINDIEYCKAYINDCLFLKKFGINKIKEELLKENISIEIIEAELANIDNTILNNRLEKMIKKKIITNKKYSNNYLKQKILNEMINLGYQKSLILEILDNNLEIDDTIIKKEFEKLYTKYSKKYSDAELIKNIKTKLLTKGFNIDEINRLVNEKTEK